MATPAKRGRPRSFDPDEVIKAAMKVFWRKGYRGASYADLTEATGLNKPSLYAAFGDKDQLFAAAMRAYQAHYIDRVSTFLTTQPDLWTALESFFDTLIDYVLGVGEDRQNATGCLMANSGVEVDAFGKDALTAFQDARTASLERFRSRLTEAVKAGQLAEQTDVETLSQYLDGQSIALAVLARTGAPREGLSKVIHLAIETVKQEKTPHTL